MRFMLGLLGLVRLSLPACLSLGASLILAVSARSKCGYTWVCSQAKSCEQVSRHLLMVMCEGMLRSIQGQHIQCWQLTASLGADEPGNEDGYVVKMTDDDLSPPYKIAPGTRVRLESLYEGDNRLLVRPGLVRNS